MTNDQIPQEPEEAWFQFDVNWAALQHVKNGYGKKWVRGDKYQSLLTVAQEMAEALELARQLITAEYCAHGGDHGTEECHAQEQYSALQSYNKLRSGKP